MITDRTELARHLVRRGARVDFLMAVALGDVDLVRRYLDENPNNVRTTVLPEQFPTTNPLAFQHIYMWSLGRNKTAHEIAKDFGHETIWRLLMERSPDDVKLLEACRLGDEDLVRDLLTANPALTQQMPNAMRSKLVTQVQEENLTAVRTMLAAGWPTDGRGQDDGTALHWAGFLGHSAIVRELLKYGADVHAREEVHGGTAMHWTLYGSVHGWRVKTGDFTGAVDALLKAGAVLPSKVDTASDAVRDFLSKHS
jgi:ankyrin repeat protein